MWALSRNTAPNPFCEQSESHLYRCSFYRVYIAFHFSWPLLKNSWSSFQNSPSSTVCKGFVFLFYFLFLGRHLYHLYHSATSGLKVSARILPQRLPLSPLISAGKATSNDFWPTMQFIILPKLVDMGAHWRPTQACPCTPVLSLLFLVFWLARF